MSRPKSIGDRLHEIEVLANGCWEWQGYVRPDGYGLICLRRNGVKTSPLIHRYFYTELVGPIPDDLVLDHKCHNADKTCTGGPDCRHRRCTNPNHLEPVTQKENILRGKGLPAENARKDFCLHGHEFTPDNTYIDAQGKRGCMACRRDAHRRYYDADGGEKKRAYARERMREVRKNPDYKERKNAWARAAYARKKQEARAA